MRVAELKQKLSGFPDEFEILVSYEMGYYHEEDLIVRSGSKPGTVVIEV